MPACFVMDCDKGSENESDYKQLMEENEYLKKENQQIKSDFLVLKEKIICTDTLIQKIEEKHKFCETLEKKYFELRRISDALKRECGIHTMEYQELLFKHGPLQKEKEILEKKCQQQEAEKEQLKNSIRCHEIVENQIKEANKKLQADLKKCTKENKLLEAKFKKLTKLGKDSEKQITNTNKKPKNLLNNTLKVSKQNEEELKEIAQNIEASFSKVESGFGQSAKDHCFVTGSKTLDGFTDEKHSPKPDLMSGAVCDEEASKHLIDDDDDYHRRLRLLYEDLRMSSDDEFPRACANVAIPCSGAVSPSTNVNINLTNDTKCAGNLNLMPQEIKEKSMLDLLGKSSKKMVNRKCRNKRKLGVEVISESEQIEVVNHLHTRKRRPHYTNINFDILPESAAVLPFEKFEKLNIEDILSLVDLARPISPLSYKSISMKQNESDEKTTTILPTDSKLPDVLSEGDSSTSATSSALHARKQRSTVKSDASQFLDSFHDNFLKLIHFKHQSLTQFLFELRNQKVNSFAFTKTVLKALVSCDFDILDIWSGVSLIDVRDPMLPPPMFRIIEILVSCGNFLDEGQEALETFLHNSFPLIIYHQEHGAFFKFKESFVSILCSCFVAILRLQGNMERVRMLLYEVVKNSPKMRVCTVVMTICAVWPQCLNINSQERGQSFSAIQQVLQYYVLASVGQESSMECFVKHLFCWERAYNPNELAFSLFHQAEVTLRQQDTSQDDAERVSWEMEAAILLMCSREGWNWTRSFIISNLLWPILGSWAINVGDFSKYFIQLVLELLGSCLHQYLHKVDKANYDNIFENLKLLVVEPSAAFCIRESALRSLLKLSATSLSPPVDVLLFVDQYRDLFEDSTNNLLQQLHA